MDYAGDLAVLDNLYILPDDGIGAEVEGKSYDEAYAELADNLKLAAKAVFLLAENLDIVIGKSEGSQPQGGGYHEEEIDIPKSTEEQHGDEDGDDDDYAAHGGHALLLDSVGVNLYVALSLRDVMAAHPLDEMLAKPCADNQGKDKCHQGAEGNV